MLLIFATRYDAVTERTFAVAQSLHQWAQELQIETVALFESHATDLGLADIISQRFRVIAFYGHGDVDGNLIAQNRLPCWTQANVPNFGDGAVYAHACRAMRLLCEQFSTLNAQLVIGYRVDLLTPADGSDHFWQCYTEIHSFLPRQLAMQVDFIQMRDEFYSLCTKRFHSLSDAGASVMELVAVQQSRDDLEVLQKKP